MISGWLTYHPKALMGMRGETPVHTKARAVVNDVLKTALAVREYA